MSPLSTFPSINPFTQLFSYRSQLFAVFSVEPNVSPYGHSLDNYGNTPE